MYTTINGVWKKTNDAFITIGGVWKKINSGFITVGGVWKKFYSSSAKPVPGVSPTLTKVNGYQTIGYTLRGNTGTWTDNPSTFFWGFQYATSATAVATAWTAIKAGGVNYYGQESFSNQNHDFLLPRYVYNASTGSDDIDLVGKYIRFYTIADNVVYTSDTFNSPAIGPIVLPPLPTGAPQLTFSTAFSASQVYVNAVWTSSTGNGTYQLQYNNAGTWTNLGAVQSTNPTSGSPLTVLVPTGNYDYRVVGYSADPGTPTLTSTSPTANYTFSPPPGAFNVTTFTKAYPGATTRSLSVAWGASTNASAYDFTVEGSNDNLIWTTVMSPATSSPVILAPNTTATLSVSIYKYYRVIIRASNNAFTQFTYSNSNTATAATGTAPSPPGVIGAVVSGASINFSWAYSTVKGSNTDNGVQWAVSTANNTPDASLTWSSPRSFTSPVSTGNLAVGTYYLYLRQWNSDELVSTSFVSTSTYYIPPAPNAFTYSLSNGGSVTTPATPTQTRVSAISNNVLFEIGSAFPSDTQSYDLLSWGPGFNSAYTQASPAVQTITTLNQWNSSGTFLGAGSSYDTIGSISSAATTSSAYNVLTRAKSNAKKIAINLSTTTNAVSWKMTYTISNAGAANGTYTDTIVSTIPLIINFGTIATNPQVVVSSVKAYSATGGTGIETIGTAGSPTTLSVDYVTADSGISSANYIYYTNYKATGSMRRISMPTAFTSSSQNVWVGTNGYVSLNTDPTTSPGTSWPTAGGTLAGTIIGPAVADLKQTSLRYSSDASNFYIRWQGCALAEANGTISIDYLMKFYWGSTTVDIYFITNNLGVATSDSSIYYNGSSYALWSASTSITGMTIPGTMTFNTTNDNVDDNRTQVLASIPVSPPGIISAPGATPTSGTAGVTTFSTSTGVWSNSPTSYGYQWKNLDQGTTWISISGATSSSYLPPSNYVTLYGSSLKCTVTAFNSGGSASSDSNTVTVSAGGGGTAPAAPTGVTLSGSGAVTWTASTGSPTSYEIEFFTASSSTGANAAPATATGYTVTGISASPYQLVSPYGGTNATWARVRVRARNAAGASAYSAWVPSATTYS